MEEFAQKVLDSLSDHIAVLDRNGQIVAVNEAWLRFARENGEPPFTVIGPGVNYLDICRRSSDQDDETACAALEGIRSVMDGSREVFTMVYPCHSPQEQRWFLMKVHHFKHQRDGVVVSHADITECKKTEDLLHESEKRLSYVLEAATEGTFDWDVKTGKVYYSPRMIESLGYSPDEVPPHVSFWEGIVHPEDMPRVQKVLKEHLEGKTEIYETENRLRKKSGEYRWNYVRGKVVERDAEGQPLRMVGVETDITGRKLAEKALRESEARLKRSQEVAHLGSWELDLVSNVLTWSDEVYRIFGLRPQEFTATYEAFLEAVHPEDRAAVDAAYSSSVREGSDTYEIEHRIIRRSDGEVRMVHEKCDHFRDSSGRIIRSVGIVHEITERKLKEEELKNAYAEIKQLKELAEAENVYLRREIKFEQGFEDIIGESDALKYVLYRVNQVAPTDMTVLIRGETGTGKGRIAYAIHKASSRKAKPMIHVNCAALPANLIESEMFGREKGAFTGAESRQIGRFELAHQGTIFLDEISELSLPLQAKLLRVIEDGEFERLGSPHTVKVDARIIASTNRNLEEEIREGRFREDLFYRLNAFPITVSPLRQRGEDIVLLVRHFVQKFNGKYGKKITNIPKSTMDALQRYPWPGNVRELANVIERAVITSQGTVLELAEKIDAISGMRAEESKNNNLFEVERAHIMRVLEETGWKIEGPKGAAKVLGINPSTLRARFRKLGIKRPEKL